MRKLQLWSYEILAMLFFVVSCAGIGCTTIKYTAPVVVKDGVSTGGEKFELSKRFVLTKVTGFKIDRKNDGSVKASFDTIENTDSKAVEVLGDVTKAAMTMAITPKIP